MGNIDIIKEFIGNDRKVNIIYAGKIGDCSKISNEPGVYFVCKSEEKIAFKEIDNNIINDNGYDVKKLEDKFSKGDGQILYIGKANSKNGGLQKRLKQYMKYGKGKCKVHKGGRAIWQIKDSDKLEIYYLETPNCEDIEKELLVKYKDIYMIYPLANWRK